MCTRIRSHIPTVTKSHISIYIPRITRTHSHTHAHIHSHACTVPPDSRSYIQPPHALQSLSLTCLPAPTPTPLPHSPLATLRGHPWGHALRPGTFAASHLAHTSHILSHPHSLSPSDSSIQRAVPYQPSGRGGTAGHGVHPARAPGGQSLLSGTSVPTASSIADSHSSLSGADRQTDRHMCTLLPSGPAPAPRQHCSSLQANAPVCSPSWRWLESDK